MTRVGAVSMLALGATLTHMGIAFTATLRHSPTDRFPADASADLRYEFDWPAPAKEPDPFQRIDYGAL